MPQFPRSTKKVNFTFNTEISPNSLYWGLVKYYRNCGTIKRREMLIEAGRVFWEPLIIYSEQGNQKKAITTAFCSVKKLSEQGELSREKWKLKFIPQRRPPLSQEIRGDQPQKFQFRYQVKSESPSGKLIKYFLDEETLFSDEEKILKPSLAYWGASAWQETKILSSVQIKEIATLCLYELHSQIKFLSQMFCLLSDYRESFRELSEVPNYQKSNDEDNWNKSQESQLKLLSEVPQYDEQKLDLKTRQKLLLSKGQFDDLGDEMFG